MQQRIYLKDFQRNCTRYKTMPVTSDAYVKDFLSSEMFKSFYILFSVSECDLRHYWVCGCCHIFLGCLITLLTLKVACYAGNRGCLN